MSWHECPQCGEEFEMYQASGYEYDTGVGPTYAPRGKKCACDLTSEQWDAIDESAADAENDWEPW